MRFLNHLLLTILLIFFSQTHVAAQTFDFMSTKSHGANVRTGPNARYPIKFTFTQAHEPVKILAKFENWYRIQDYHGAEGWIHSSLISKKQRFAVTIADSIELYDNKQNIIAWLQQNVYIKIKSCQEQKCKISVQDLTGWLDKTKIWGVEKHEIF